MYFSHIEVIPENGFPGLPIHKGSINSMPSDFFKLEACKLHYCNTKGLLWKRRGGKMGVCGLAPEKFSRTTLSRISENALLEHRVKVAVIIDLCVQKESDVTTLT